MPTYEYGCKACGYRFEELQSITADPIDVSPKCGEKSVQRFVSGGAGLIFKGSGFYITDYAKKNSSPAASGNGNGSTHTSSKSNKDTSESPAEKPTHSESSKTKKDD